MRMRKALAILISVLFLPVRSIAEDNPAGYRIGPGDDLTVSLPIQGSLADLSKLGGTLPIEVVQNTVYWRHDVHVEPDGTVRIPTFPPIQIAGLTLDEVRSKVAALASGPKGAPVSVSLKKSDSSSFYVWGEVRNPGRFALERPTTLLEALGYAGGIQERGRANHVMFLREGQEPRIFDFTPKKIKETTVQPIYLTTKDTIVVPRKRTPDSFTWLLIISAISAATGIYVAARN